MYFSLSKYYRMQEKRIYNYYSLHYQSLAYFVSFCVAQIFFLCYFKQIPVLYKVLIYRLWPLYTNYLIFLYSVNIFFAAVNSKELDLECLLCYTVQRHNISICAFILHAYKINETAFNNRTCILNWMEIFLS